MASESISSDRIRARQSRGSLQRPRLGPSCVARPRLVHRLSGATTLPVTTLIAPAGYGKTTAVLEWLSSEPTHSAWLSVDETDDDLQSFAIHVVSALQRRVPHIPVILAPASVQGVNAPVELLKSLHNLISWRGLVPGSSAALSTQNRAVDVILMVRGGGSMEDLWAFNDEALVTKLISR